MGSPLDGADVNTVLMHFPQGAELTKLIDVVFDGGNGVIDFFFGRIPTNGDAQTAVGQLITAAQGTQNLLRNYHGTP